jgi:hypothetical protein
VFNVVEISGFHGMPPPLKDTFEIILVHRSDERRVLQFFERFAEVTEDLLVDEFDLPSGAHRAYQPWNRIHDQAKIQLAFTKSVLSPLSILDIRVRPVPFDDRS